MNGNTCKTEGNIFALTQSPLWSLIQHCKNILFFLKAALAEKRKAEEEAAEEEESSKRQRLEVEGDVASETIAQILTTITDPNEMVGPDVSSHR